MQRKWGYKKQQISTSVGSTANLQKDQEQEDRTELSDGQELKTGLSKSKKLFNKLSNILFGNLTENQCRFLLIYLFIISLLELLAYGMQGIYSLVASRIWVLGGCVCFLNIIASFMKAIVQDSKEKKFLSITTVFLLLLFLGLLCGNVNFTEINPDAAQQAAAGMNSFMSRDWNYAGTAFLGYPNRQYIITALPALVFGRSIATLQMGFAIPFILGIMILYSTLRKWAGRYRINTFLAVPPLYALFVFPFVTEYYVNFEQAIYPISFTMIALGLYLHLICKPNIITLVSLAWIGCLLSNTYTPALASLGLIMVFIALASFLWKAKPEYMPFSVSSPNLSVKAFLLVDMNILLFFLATVFGKRKDRITTVREDLDLLRDSLNTIYDFLTDRNATFLGMFGVLVILYLLASLTLRLKVRDLLVSLWVLAVFSVSNMLAGYTSYEPAWIMQRALIVIPVIIVAVTITIFDIAHKHNFSMNEGMLAVVVMTFAFIGLHNFGQINQSFTYFNRIQPMKYLLKDTEVMIKEEELNHLSEFNLILYTEDVFIKNLADYCTFLYPNAKVFTPDFGAYPQELDPELKTFIYGTKEFTGTPEGTCDVLDCYNPKHRMTVTWNRKKVEGSIN